MERIVRLRIEKLPEGLYLGTSDDVQGLVVQAKTVAEVLECAQDAIRVIREVRAEHGLDEPEGEPVPDAFIVPLVLAA